jgi:hypothetical protein
MNSLTSINVSTAGYSDDTTDDFHSLSGSGPRHASSGGLRRQDHFTEQEIYATLLFCFIHWFSSKIDPDSNSNTWIDSFSYHKMHFISSIILIKIIYSSYDFIISCTINSFYINTINSRGNARGIV